MARIGTKLCQNAFQTIPDVLSFEAKKLFFDKNLESKILFFANLAWFWRSHDRIGVKISFLVKFCSRWTYPEVCTSKKSWIW